MSERSEPAGLETSATFGGESERAGDLLEEINELIARLEAHPDSDVREQLQALLIRMDTVHRTALTHLVEGIRGMAGDAFLNRLTADPAVRLLLMSYDLIAVDRRILAEEALDAVRRHLHAHRVDVTLDEVVGGVVYVRLHGIERAALNIDDIRRDIEAALKDGLIGFQQLELNGRPPPAMGGLVSLGDLRRARRPVLVQVADEDDLPIDTVKAVEPRDVPILLANLDGTIHAVQNRCGESPLPLQFGEIDGSVLVCPWHGCRYDLRSGRRTDGGAERLAVYPVSVESGRISVALSVEVTANTNGES